MLTEHELTDKMIRDLLRSLPDVNLRTADEGDIGAACRWALSVQDDKFDVRRRIVDYINAGAKQAAEPEQIPVVPDSSPDAILASIIDQMQRLASIGVASHGIGLIVEAVKALAVVQQQTRIETAELAREVRDLRRDVRA